MQLEVNYRPAGFDSTLNKAVLPNNDIPINETQYSQNSSEPKRIPKSP